MGKLNSRLDKMEDIIGTLKKNLTLVGVAQWIEYGPVNQRAASWFPIRAHTWVAGQVPSRGCVRGNHTLMFLSIPPSLLHSKNK